MRPETNEGVTKDEAFDWAGYQPGHPGLKAQYANCRLTFHPDDKWMRMWNIFLDSVDKCIDGFIWYFTVTKSCVLPVNMRGSNTHSDNGVFMESV